MGILMKPLAEITGTRKWLINFYQEQLDYFHKVGLGKYTTHDVKITSTLIRCTEKRLEDLSIIYDAKLTPQAHRLRRLRYKRLKQEKVNGHTTTSNGAATDESCEDIRTNGHERSKS